MVTVVAVLAQNLFAAAAARGHYRPVEQWAAGDDVDRATALKATYTFGRSAVSRALWVSAICFAPDIGHRRCDRRSGLAATGPVRDSRRSDRSCHSTDRSTQLVWRRPLRPARFAIAGDTDIGDSLPRARPTIAAWSSMTRPRGPCSSSPSTARCWRPRSIGRRARNHFCSVGIGGALTLGLREFRSPSASRSHRRCDRFATSPQGTERVAAGDYSQRLPVVQDDDLGALAASFNRMQAGLAERQRLQAAFGTYVDPVLAARLLEQGDDVFTGERREVTVMFVDIRDFTPFAEANTAEDTVARLNALFEIVVPAVVDAGGHVNKFLGDGALAVFGAPNDLADHADAAVNAAMRDRPTGRRAIRRRASDRHRYQHRCGDRGHHRRRKQAGVHPDR